MYIKMKRSAAHVVTGHDLSYPMFGSAFMYSVMLHTQANHLGTDELVIALKRVFETHNKSKVRCASNHETADAVAIVHAV